MNDITPRKHITSRSWMPEQDAKLTDLISKGASATRAAAALNRTVGSVQTRARNLGIPFKSTRVKRGTWIGPNEYRAPR
jgi:hypothetical protein